MKDNLFIVSLTYKKELEDVEIFIDKHVCFLDKYYKQGKFIFSGRKNPRTGGVILAYNITRMELELILKEDPFWINQIADYDIIEVAVTKYAEAFESFIKKGSI